MGLPTQIEEFCDVLPMEHLNGAIHSILICGTQSSSKCIKKENSKE